jgi:hypothetical protein
MPVTKMPNVVACTGAVVVASESSKPEATVTLTLKTETGNQYLLPLSELAINQLFEVISEFRRTRQFLFEEELSTATTLH